MTNVVISIIILLALLLFGLPLPIVFFTATIYMVISSGVDPSFAIPYGYNKINSLTILIIPLFIIAGAFMQESSIGDKLLSAAEKLVGRKVKGGIGVAVCIACAIFGAISGSANAALTTLSLLSETLCPWLFQGFCLFAYGQRFYFRLSNPTQRYDDCVRLGYKYFRISMLPGNFRSWPCSHCSV